MNIERNLSAPHTTQQQATRSLLHAPTAGPAVARQFYLSPTLQQACSATCARSTSCCWYMPAMYAHCCALCCVLSSSLRCAQSSSAAAATAVAVSPLLAQLYLLGHVEACVQHTVQDASHSEHASNNCSSGAVTRQQGQKQQVSKHLMLFQNTAQAKHAEVILACIVNSHVACTHSIDSLRTFTAVRSCYCFSHCAIGKGSKPHSCNPLAKAASHAAATPLQGQQATQLQPLHPPHNSPAHSVVRNLYQCLDSSRTTTCSRHSRQSTQMQVSQV